MQRLINITDTNNRMAHVGAACALTVFIALPFFVLPMPFALLAPVALAFVPFAIHFSFANPFVLCIIFIVFSFFRIHEAFPVLGPLRIPSLVAIPTLAVLGWQLFLSRELKPFFPIELKVFAIFFALVTLGVAFAVNRPTALAAWSGSYWKIATMTLAIAWLTRTPRDFSRVATALIVAGCAIAYVAITNKHSGIGLVEGTRVTIGRDIGSVLGDPNDLALALLFPLAFAASYVAFRPSRLKTLLGLLAVGMIIYAIICTQSRGGLLGILSVAGIIGLRVIKSKFLLLSIGAVAGIGLLVAMGINDRKSGGAHEEGIDESAMGRIYAWQAAWSMALARPLNGVGLNNFTDNYFFHSPHWDGNNHAVHSTWFGVLAETGFPGVILFLSMITITARSAYWSMVTLDRIRAPPDLRAMALALVAGLAGFCAAGTFLTQGFTWPIYILLALTTATARYARMTIENMKLGKHDPKLININPKR